MHAVSGMYSVDAPVLATHRHTDLQTHSAAAGREQQAVVHLTSSWQAVP